MNFTKISLTIGAVLFLSGCMTAPQYTRPESLIPQSWPEGDAYKQSQIEGALQAERIKWQAVFVDENLQKVIGLSLENNRDLRTAALNVERARALYGVQRAEMLPSVSASSAGSQKRLPADLSSTGKRMTTEQYSVDLGIASWEIDLFGRLRNLSKQALEEYLALEQVQRGAQTALISEVARVYLTLAADLQNLKLAQSTLETQKNVYLMIQQQFEKGVATEVDLRRSQTQVDAAKGDIARYTQTVAQDKNALTLLAGTSIPNDLLPSDLESVKAPLDVSQGLSSEILLRRPDIMAAEHQLKAASAFIGAARAAFFPRISLTTTAGTASSALSGLFDSGSGTWTFVPQISMPIFDARVWSALRVSKVTREIALTQYESTIQAAFRDVSDALAVRGTIDQQVASQQAIVESAQKVYELSDKRYTQGIDGYLSVLDAQRSLYSAQQGLTLLRLAKLTNQVRLFAVLGGD